MEANLRITIPMSLEERERLYQAAQLDLRHPRDQARYLLRLGLGLAAATNEPNKHNCAVSPFQSGDGAIVAAQ